MLTRRVVLAISLLLATGCTSDEQPTPEPTAPESAARPTGGPGAATEPAALDELLADVPEAATIRALRVEGAAPTLSWGEVRGARTYEVTVVPARGARVWGWRGNVRRVVHGTIGGQTAAALEAAGGGTASLGEAARGVDHAWFVRAFDEDGTLVAVSDIAMFRCRAGTCRPSRAAAQ